MNDQDPDGDHYTSMGYEREAPSLEEVTCLAHLADLLIDDGMESGAAVDCADEDAKWFCTPFVKAGYLMSDGSALYLFPEKFVEGCCCENEADED